MKNRSKTEKRMRRRKKIRAKIKGTAERPRLSVFRSNRFVYAQLIDDAAGKTLAAMSSKDAKGKTHRERAKHAGKVLAEKAKSKKVLRAVFDRGGYVYTGKVKALAEGAREEGLKF